MSRHLFTRLLLFAFAAIAIGTASWLARGWFERRRVAQRHLIEKTFDIRVDDFEEGPVIDKGVFGREIHYLERSTESRRLVIFLHGLGLDGDDFRADMNIASQHTVAITLFGFNASDAHDRRYRPVGLATHSALVNRLIREIQRQNPRKTLTLVGFSLGADMLFRLADLWRDHPESKPRVSSVVLLDPNINHSTMIVSSGFARMNPDEPIAELKRIAQIPGTLIEFQNFCEYLHKISRKDLAQIQRHAQDFWDYWEPDGKYDLFLERVDRLRAAVGGLKIFFSTHYEENFNDVVVMGRQKGLRGIFNLERIDHFELFRDVFLERNLGPPMLHH